jgi:hypothetical protein
MEWLNCQKRLIKCFGGDHLTSGYDARKTPSAGIHDDLYASALCFSDEKTRILLVTTDLIGIRSDLADYIKSIISSLKLLVHPSYSNYFQQ